MLERETELIKQIIVESTIDGRDAIKLNEVIAANLPRGVKAFMIAETMKLLESDFQQSSNLARITRTVARTVTTERTFLRSLAMEYLFQRDEYTKLVEDTVHFLENYLCRPQWTLEQMLFEKAPTISFDKLVRQFEYIVDYAYFGELVERHVRRRGWTEITDEQFKSLLARIDEEVVKQHSPRELALLTKPIFDFLLFGDPSMHRPIPLGAILLFFEDKKMTAAKEYIDRICHIRSREQLSVFELISIIEDLYQVESAVKEEVKETEEEILAPLQQTAQLQPEESATEQPPELDATATTIEQIAETEFVAPEPITPSPTEPTLEEIIATENSVVEVAEESQTLETLSSVEPPIETVSEPILAEQKIEEPEIELPFEQQTATITEVTGDATILDTSVSPIEETTATNPIVHVNELIGFAHERNVQRHSLFLTFPERGTKKDSQPTLPEIDLLLSDEQRLKFIKKIFKGSDIEYGIFVASLNKAQTWREAQLHLRDLFQMNKLDYLSPDVVEFTDAMHSRYEPELNRTE